MSEYDTGLLGWLPLNDRLNDSMQRAFGAAMKAGKDEVGIEHLLAAFLEDIDANIYFAQRDVDRGELRKFCVSQIGADAVEDAISGVEVARQPATRAAPAVQLTATPTQATAPQPSSHYTSHTPTPVTYEGTSAHNGVNGTSYNSATGSSGSAASAYNGETDAHSSSATSYNNGAADYNGAAPDSHYGTRETQSQSYNGGVNGATSTASSSSYHYSRSSWSKPASSTSPYHRPKLYNDGARSASSFGAHTTSPTQSLTVAQSDAAQSPAVQPTATPASTPQPVAVHSTAIQPSLTSAQATKEDKKRPRPAAALRRVMAQASDFAECAENDEINSQTVIRAIAVDPDTNSGRFLRAYLKQKDIGSSTLGRRAAEDKSEEMEAVRAAAEHAAMKAERVRQSAAEQSPPAFEVITKSCETIINLLQRELQKDIRYRLATDLSDFLNARETGGALVAHESSHLSDAAHPILRTAESELRSDPDFQAYEQLRNTLRALKMIEGPLQDRLGRLQNVHDEHGHIIRSIKQLLDLQPIVDFRDDEYPDTRSDYHSSYEAGSQTPLEEAYGFAQGERQSHQYHDETSSFVMIDEEQPKWTYNLDTSVLDEETDTADVHKEKKRGFLSKLFTWRRGSDTQATQQLPEEDADDIPFKYEGVKSTTASSETEAGEIYDSEGLTNNGFASAEPQQETIFPMSRQAPRSTLLHTSAIAVTLIAAGAVAAALRAHIVL